MTTDAMWGFSPTVVPDPYDGVVQPGCGGACIYIPDTTYKAVVSGICGKIERIRDIEIRMQVCGFCSTLSTGLTRLQPGLDLSPMYTELLEDEAYFEWIFDNFRFGFSFRHDSADSYWFLVAKDPRETSRRFRGDFNAGFLPPVEYVLEYIRSNA